MNAAALAGEPFVYVYRGDVVESVHAVAVCARNVAGAIVLSLGDVETPVFLRSTAKPFIAAALVHDGTAGRFGFEPAELAVIAASHGGEPHHLAAVRGILAKIGLDAAALQCGTHAPYYEPAARALAVAGDVATALHSNCSGKHAGILASCVAHGEDVEHYRDAAHPVQRRILAFCSRLLDEPHDLPLGIDGCGIPVFATSLYRAARAFARLASPGDPAAGLDAREAEALVRVRDAMAAHPALVAGTGRFDTALIEAGAGSIVAKSGAEGVLGAAAMDARLGLVLKVIDGAARAVPVAAVPLLARAGMLGERERVLLAPFARPELRNVAGTVIGRLDASDTTTAAQTSSVVPSLPKD